MSPFTSETSDTPVRIVASSRTGRRAGASAYALLTMALGCGDDGATDDPTSVGGADAVGTATTSSTASTSFTVASSSASGDGGGAACGPSGVPRGSAACDACTAESCCAESAACAARPGCAEQLDCIDACAGDVPCLEACPLVTDPAGVDLALCQLKECEACAHSDVVCELIVLATGARDQQACDACVQQQCCDEIVAGITVERIEYLACSLDCLDASCLRQCELDHPDGLAPQDAILECGFGEACGDVCVHQPGCGVFGFPDDACGSCIEANVCAQHEACSFDSRCLDFFTCAIECSSADVCRECLALWPPEVAGLGSSMLWSAPIACEGTCDGEVCGLVPALDASDCSSCVREACCEPSAACMVEPSCVALQICVGLCEEDEGCVAACREDHADGAALFEPLETCKGASCADDCP